MKNYSKKTIRRDGTLSTPFIVPAGVKTLKVSFTERHTVKNGAFHPTKSLDEYGRVWTWGANANGQVGDGSVTNRTSPVALLGQNWKAPFVRADGQMVNMGQNQYGQIGDNTTVPKSTPTLVVGGIRFKKVVRGSTCVGLAENGNLYVWGRNQHGQIGDGTIVDKSTPVQVMPGTTFTDFWTDEGNYFDIDSVSQPNTIFAKASTTETYAWGRDNNSVGQLGTGTFGSLSTPTLVVGSLNFTKISTQTQGGLGGFTLGLTEAGAIYSWGYNGAGQLGDNTIVTKSSPSLVIGGYLFADIAAGTEHGLGLTRDGVVYAWGNNGQGQLGQGNIFPKSSPVTVTGLTSGCKRIAVAQSANYVIDDSNRIYAWGNQEVLTPVLGSGDNVDKSTPTIVNPIGSYGIVEDIIEPLNGSFVAVITKYNTRYAWGSNGGAQGNFGANLAGGTYNTAQFVTGPAFGALGQPQITGNIWHKRPSIKVETHTADVTPGQTITVAHQTGAFAVPELGLLSSVFCEQVDIEWEG